MRAPGPVAALGGTMVIASIVVIMAGSPSRRARCCSPRIRRQVKGKPGFRQGQELDS
jgi:hypothetical protein